MCSSQENKLKGKVCQRYEQTFSKKIFRVTKFIQRVPQPVYELTDFQDRPIECEFYNYELVKVTVSPQTEFELDKFVRTRNNDGINQHFVKCRLYDMIFNFSIIPTDIKKI